MPQGPNPVNVAVNPTDDRSPMELGYQGELLVSDLHGGKYAQALAGNLFRGVNPFSAPVTTSVSLATTYVGCCLSNPAGNTKNLVVRKVFANINVAFAALTSYGLIQGYAAGGITAHTTPLAPFSSKIGSGIAATAKLDSACTLVGTPAWAEWLAESPAATQGLSFSVNLDGGIVLIPGAYLAVGSSIAGPTSGFMGGFEWEEVAIPA